MRPQRGSSLIEVLVALGLATGSSWAVLQASQHLGPLRDRSSGLRLASALAQDESDALAAATGCRSSQRTQDGITVQVVCSGSAARIVLSWSDRRGRQLTQQIMLWRQPAPQGDG
ncbi:type IV pilus modification PilV family protein [Amphibiibacter pelophylacis]|uniref:Uncharacterized protein n=1 Tax=Amphibiibacter pelophylacis TaxID=1799477 RepID=A0ACC6P3P0_9BURK